MKTAVQFINVTLHYQLIIGCVPYLCIGDSIKQGVDFIWIRDLDEDGVGAVVAILVHCCCHITCHKLFSLKRERERDRERERVGNIR